MPFAGFGPNALPLLKALAFHQSKDWFDANKAAFEADLKTPMGGLVETLAENFAKAKIPLKGDRKTALFRQHRDVRFSKDKSPYKTHVGAVLTPTRAKNGVGVFYIHIEPAGCFTAAGFYDPETETLARFRAAIAAKPQVWKRALAALAKADLALSQDYAMKRNPRGFEAVEEDEAVQMGVRLKSFVVRRPVSDARIGSAKLADDLVAFVRDARPLLNWGWDALA
jgi:uncharacterized protein (TIGR02453 family)